MIPYEYDDERPRTPPLEAHDPACLLSLSPSPPPEEHPRPQNLHHRAIYNLLISLAQDRSDIADEARRSALNSDSNPSSTGSGGFASSTETPALDMNHVPVAYPHPCSREGNASGDPGPIRKVPHGYTPIRIASPTHTSPRHHQHREFQSVVTSQQHHASRQYDRRDPHQIECHDERHEIFPDHRRMKTPSSRCNSNPSEPDAAAVLVSLKQGARRQSNGVTSDYNRTFSRDPSANQTLPPIQNHNALGNGSSASSPSSVRQLPALQEVIGDVSIASNSPMKTHLLRSPLSSVSTLSGPPHTSYSASRTENSRSRSLSIYSQSDRPLLIPPQPPPDRVNSMPVKSPTSPSSSHVGYVTARRRSSLITAPILPYPSSASSTSTAVSPSVFDPKSSSRIESSHQTSDTSSPREPGHRLPILDESQTLPPLHPAVASGPKLAAAGEIPAPPQPPLPQQQYKCDFEGCTVPPFPTPYLLR